MSSKELVFQERSIMSNHITPQRDVGATFRFQYNEWRMSLGAFNGNGNPLGDDNPGILLVGRAEYNNSETPLETTYGVVEEPILQAGVGAFYNRDTATSEVGAGGDLLFRWDGLAVLLDAQWIRIDPTSTTIDTPGVLDRTHRLGAVLQVGYSIRGRLEPAARLEYFDDNLSLRDNGDLILGMLGVTSHLRNDTLRLGAGYVLRYELAGTSVPNDTLRAWVQASW